MAYELEKDYLTKLPINPLSSVAGADLDKLLFSASEDLSGYHPRHITPRIVVLQAMYKYEASMSEYETLRRQGVQSFSTKRGSITFGSSGSSSSISPEITDILGAPPARGGRFA